jgi:acetyl-CoA acetyltransferase
MAIRSVAFGDARYAIAVGAEKMVVGDLGRVLSALQNSSDTAVTQGLGVQFVSIYAMRLQDALDRGIITRGHLARVTVKNQHNGSLNPYAQYGAEMTEREVLEARAIAGPFTLPMVAGISDGAAAVVVANEGDETRVRILASALTSGASEALDEAASVRAVRTAYEQAGVGPEDLDVAEVHDAVSGSELLYYEQLGLCAAEDIGDFLDSGASALGGSSPVNPSGGLTARGHPVGATGLAQVAELTWQITGRAGGRQVESASIGLSQNSGGWLAGDSAASAVHILGAN